MPGRVVNISSGHASPGPQVVPRQERPVPAIRRTMNTMHTSEPDKLLPGLIEKEDSVYRNQGNSYLTSTTQMNNVTDIVSQRGAEERRRYMMAGSSTPYRSPGPSLRPVSTVRPQSAMATASPSSFCNISTPVDERPPSSLGVAWGSSPKPSHGNRNMTDGRVNPVSSHNSINNSHANGQYGQQHYDDNELIFPVHQRSQSYGDGVTLGQGYNGVDKVEDVYAVVTKRQDRVPRNQDTTSGYVPSQLYDRRDNARPDGQMRYQSKSMSSYTNQDAASPRGSGQDNMAYVPDDSQNRQPQSKGKIPASHDLRSAWQRLYGSRPDQVISNQRQSADNDSNLQKIPSMEDVLRTQNSRQQNTQHQSPHTVHPHNGKTNIQQSLHSTNNNTPNNSNRLRDGSFHNNGSVPSHNMGSKNILHGSNSQFPHHSLNPARESPTGQSSSNPDQVSGSNNSSQLSSYSVTNRNLSTFKPEKVKNDYSDPSIGPAAKYPDMQLSGRPGDQSSLFGQRKLSRQIQTSLNQFSSELVSPRRQRTDSTNSESVQFNVGDNFPLSRSRRHKTSNFLDSEDELGDDFQLRPLDSIFDYADGSENDSVTPPLPPLSPAETPQGSGHSTPTNMSPRFIHSRSKTAEIQQSPPKTPDLLRPTSGHSSHSHSHNAKTEGATSGYHDKTSRSHVHVPVKEEQYKSKSGSGASGSHQARNIPLTAYARSRSLEDVRESGTESIISFDVENTLLMVDPSDQSEMGTARSQKSSSVKAQLNRLEGMYSQVMKTLTENPHGTRRRRWSIGSSDASSMRQHTHQSRHGRSTHHRMSSKTVGKRFQRLESHVITLARSVAHLSSELRSHNTMSREIENVKRQMHELKNQSQTVPQAPGHFMGGGNRLLTEFERYRGWVPSLTNPKRVNKLTKFFGQEPPLLEIFLKRLGYEKFIKNFEDEHIGMIELPYMTEDRLQSIGIPMGPRLRILQEAQMCFQQGNFDIYFV